MRFTLVLPLALISLSHFSIAHPLAEPEVSERQFSDISLPFTIPTLPTASLAFSIPSLSLPTNILSERQLASTENGLTTDTTCKSVIVIFARGTSEIGNVGTVAGPPMFAQLRNTLGTGNVTVQGVAYAADDAGYLEGGDPTGSSTMASLVNQASTKCPQAHLVLSGYSQGAQLVHNAAKTLSVAVTAQIAAVVVFGDPDKGQAVGTVDSSKVDSICHAEDIICTKAGSFVTHLTYGNDAAAAASFVVSAVGGA